MKRKIVAGILTACILAVTACGTPANAPEDPTENSIPPTVVESVVQGTESAVQDQSEEAVTERQFTDSVGRTVIIPDRVDRIAVTGPMAQIVVFALCPDKLVGIADKWSSRAEEFIQTQYYDLPLLGQLYGGKGEINPETLLQSEAQVVIDVGEPKKTATEDLDGLQTQTGIPFVHISADTESMGAAYRKLGELLGCEREAEVLADYCEEKLQMMEELAGKVKKANLVYCVGDKGLNVIAKGSYHGEIIDLMANNLAVVDAPSSKGTGNEVDLEQLMLWNPEVIIFGPDSIYETVAEDPAWQSLQAIASGNYYQAPFGPYNWMGFPPSVQRYLGMFWMGKVLYPEEADYDLYGEVKEYFRLFYHCELTEEQFLKLCPPLQ